jgi:hypothetical protein
MAVQGEPNRPSYSRKSRHPHGRESQTQFPAASADKKSRSSLLKHLRELLGKLSISLGILLVVLCLACGCSVDMFLGSFLRNTS